MKSLQALGLVLMVIGGMLLAAVVSLRPLGGALAICGAGLLVFGWINPTRLSRRRKAEPFHYEDDGTRPPQPIYQAQPGEVRLRERPSDVEVEFTTPNPGAIPAQRQSQPGPAGAEYSTGRAEIPMARERERSVPEYTTPVDSQPDASRPAPLTATGLGPEAPPDADPYLPPMAPPPRA